MTLKGVTQRDAAKHIRVSASTFSNKINGNIRFSAEETASLAELLNVSTDALLGLTPMEVSSCAGR